MGRTTFTIEKDTVLTSKSEQQSIFTPNQEWKGNIIAMHCLESSKVISIKTKDTDILILMMYSSEAATRVVL